MSAIGETLLKHLDTVILGLTLVVTALMARYNGKSVDLMKKASLVVCSLETPPNGQGISLLISNDGDALARDVRIRLEPDPTDKRLELSLFEEAQFNDSRFNRIQVLRPQAVVRMELTFHGPQSESDYFVSTASVEWKDSTGEERSAEYVLDSKFTYATTYATPEVQALNGIERQLWDISSKMKNHSFDQIIALTTPAIRKSRRRASQKTKSTSDRNKSS